MVDIYTVDENGAFFLSFIHLLFSCSDYFTFVCSSSSLNLWDLLCSSCLVSYTGHNLLHMLAAVTLVPLTKQEPWKAGRWQNTVWMIKEDSHPLLKSQMHSKVCSSCCAWKLLELWRERVRVISNDLGTPFFFMRLPKSFILCWCPCCSGAGNYILSWPVIWSIKAARDAVHPALVNDKAAIADTLCLVTGAYSGLLTIKLSPYPSYTKHCLRERQFSLMEKVQQSGQESKLNVKTKHMLRLKIPSPVCTSTDSPGEGNLSENRITTASHRNNSDLDHWSDSFLFVKDRIFPLTSMCLFWFLETNSTFYVFAKKNCISGRLAIDFWTLLISRSVWLLDGMLLCWPLRLESPVSLSLFLILILCKLLLTMNVQSTFIIDLYHVPL